MNIKHALAAAAALSLATPAFAEYDRISFESEVSQEVANDEMRATLVKTAQADNAQDIAKILNRTINEALKIAKKYPDVQVSTGRQSTYLRYADNSSTKIVGFTGSASLELKSQDFSAASQLMADLQALMVTENLNFGVSEATRATAQKQLAHEAAKRFQSDALAISHSFGAQNYKIVNVQLNSNRYSVAPMMYSAKLRDASGGIEAQNMEAGSSKLSYSANGTIELVR
ncbi:hypothetical protein B0181_05175 [Moraxella caviae]|uniref:Predicted periplasmic/secreted protein n=1 Tax=Moraxella caviae TaxID=34060 RepID=A0A1T0A3B9_9GAMM|nr:SIMPL domain-containing protein [Moraxella caviae]OOR90049.1 hypothetical protein B0181_05175 [Moraxella caviae]STZ14652.1 Predicted periplasmic/secreted protein [Moraxella caviae]VEW13328.1 Predicted periplasmic/secreted protein [Moraxella caviae]